MYFMSFTVEKDRNNMKSEKQKPDFGRIEQDLKHLSHFEKTAAADYEALKDLDTWKATPYEQFFLPGLRLLGIPEQENITLQNTADLHLHTQWSDGDKLDRVLKQALALKLDAIAITDHDEIDGALEARRLVHEKRLRIAVIPGIEISSRDGHIGALFVMKKIPKGLSAIETVDLIHQAGGIAVAHHPYSPKWIDRILNMTLGCGDLIKEVPFDAVEIVNAVPGKGVKYNIQAIDKMRENHVRIAVTGSSDAHKAQFVGKGKTYWAGNEGVVSLYKAFEYGFTQGAEGYWKTSEKIAYYQHLIISIIKNKLKKFGSVN